MGHQTLLSPLFVADLNRIFALLGSGLSKREIMLEMIGIADRTLEGVGVITVFDDRDLRPPRVYAAGLEEMALAALSEHPHPEPPAPGSPLPPLLIEDFDASPPAPVWSSLVSQYRFRASWSVPVVAERNQVLGAFTVWRARPGPPTEAHQAIVELIAHLASVVISRFRLDKALAHSEAHLRQIYDNVRDVVFLIGVDPDGRFRFEAINPSFSEATGLSEEQVVGRFVEDVIPEPSSAMVIEKYRQAIRERRPLSWEEITPFPTGTKTGEVTISPIFDSRGRCLRLVGSVHDITEHKRLEDSLRISEETFRLLFETSRDGILMMTPERRCIRANPAAVAMFGFESEQAFLAVSAAERSPEFQPDGARSEEKADAILQRCMEGQFQYYDWTYRRRDGSEFVAEMMTARMDIGGESILQVSLRDITEKTAAQERLKRITQLYAALSQCNQAIIHCRDEQELLDRVCDIAVKYGGMAMAWIGILDEGTPLIRPVASAGSGTEYLQEIEVSTDPGSATGRGPGGTALRERRPVWCQDFAQDPNLVAWHGPGRKYGWGSVAALPLYRKGSPVGVFLLYSQFVDAFDDEIRKLLLEMADDISFALDYLFDESERERERLQMHKLSSAVEQSHNMVLISDLAGTIEYANRAFERVTGYPSELLVGENLHELQGEHSPFGKCAEVWSGLALGESWQGEVPYRRKDGSELILYSRISPMGVTSGQPSHYLCISEDITERKKAESRIEYLANFDELTGLPNRVQLTQRCTYALSIARRNHRKLALMFLDLDHFKNINDTNGHGIGDLVLKETALRLREALREEDVVSRFGGDEFILMIPDCDADGAASVAHKMLEVVARPIRAQGREFVITGSIGITLFPDDGDEFEMLAKNADMAMYLAKREGRGCFRFYTEQMQIATARNIRLIEDLRYTLSHDQLRLHYQPQFSGNRLIGVEVLLRWEHQELGTVSPGEFIPLAEESGLIIPIGEWVLRNALRQLKTWIEQGYSPITMAVNLSPVQFRDTGLFDLVARILREADIPPSWLELELTEGAAMFDPDKAVQSMRKLHRLGVRLSIDDFGTGYSSLSYLKKFNIYKLKIDQDFVRDIHTDAEDRAIVGAIISMANRLGLVTIAEGVETEEQIRFLREQGCNEMQGFYFSPPVPAEDFEKLLARYR